jgi:hypothetical protein
LYVTSEDYYHHSLVIDNTTSEDYEHRELIVITTPEDYYRRSSLVIPSSLSDEADDYDHRKNVLVITSGNHDPSSRAVLITRENYNCKSLLVAINTMANMATTATTTIEDIEIGEKTPLFQSNDYEKPLEDVENSTRREKAVAGVSAISFGTSFAAMIFEGNLLVYISGLVGILVAPYATIQQQKITEVDALKETNERGAYCIALRLLYCTYSTVQSNRWRRFEAKSFTNLPITNVLYCVLYLTNYGFALFAYYLPIFYYTITLRLQCGKKWIN